MDETAELLARHLGLAPVAPERAVLRLLIELAAQFVGAQEGSLLVLDRTQVPPRHLVFAMTVGSRVSEKVLAGQRVPLGEGVTGLAALTREVQMGAPFYAGVQQARSGSQPLGEPHSVIASPILCGDELAGVITAVSFEPNKRFTADQARLYARAGAITGVVIEQSRRLTLLERSPSSGAAEGSAREARVRERFERLLQARHSRIEDLDSLLAVLERLLGSGTS